jgi:hypothetical protein
VKYVRPTKTSICFLSFVEVRRKKNKVGKQKGGCWGIEGKGKREG